MHNRPRHHATNLLCFSFSFREVFPVNFPLLLFLTSLLFLNLAVRVGDWLRSKSGQQNEDSRTETGPLLSATLTLLYLIIGFSFVMAVSRYDVRKNSENAEAIAIGTEYSRADLLTPADSAKVKPLLKKYLDQRLLFYGQRGSVTPADTERLQTELWSALRPAIAEVPPPLMGVLVTGMNDLVNTQRSTQAAWMNRIPLAAWALMAAIGTGCCLLIGFRSRRRDWLAFAIVPLSASLCFFLIADLDSPQGGVIRVVPQNLMILAQSISGQ
jgi:hypothetical protein